MQVGKGGGYHDHHLFPNLSKLFMENHEDCSMQGLHVILANDVTGPYQVHC
jgi:hypothetical protein